MEIILASASPRRQELLGYVFKSFVCKPANVDETLPENIMPMESAEMLAVKKAKFIANENSDALVIGCDTVVIYENEIFGKPTDEMDAKRMLEMLSGKTHYVVTGVALFYKGKSVSFSERTSVKFYDLTECEMLDYIATGQPMDKAGAYGIQDKNFLPVKSIEGDYFNVVGLPIARLKREVESFLIYVGVR